MLKETFHGLPFELQSDDGSETYNVGLFNSTMQNLYAVWLICKKHRVTLPDFMRDDYTTFLNVALSPQTIILSVNDVGIVYMTDLIPGESATGHYLFWDKRLTNRSRLILRCMKWGFETWGLKRISVILPKYATAALHHVYKMGLRVEGLFREYMSIDGKRADCLAFGVLRRELTDEVLETGQFVLDEEQKNWYYTLNNEPALMRKVMGRNSHEPR